LVSAVIGIFDYSEGLGASTIDSDMIFETGDRNAGHFATPNGAIHWIAYQLATIVPFEPHNIATKIKISSTIPVFLR
jgi:hypothetical protein